MVGTGNIAGGYARDIPTHPEIRLIAATDLDRARAAAFADEHGIDAYGSLEELLADDRIDIVLNLTVHHAHFAVTKQALEAGRHVYSEKPLALNASDAPRARRAREGPGRSARWVTVHIPRRGPADRGGADQGRAARYGSSDLRGRQLGPDRDVAPGTGALLRCRCPCRCRCLSAHAGHDDARAGALSPSMGLELKPRG